MFLKSQEKYLGFDDRLMILLGIPFVALLINTLLFGYTLQSQEYDIFGSCYFIAFYFTSLYWLAFRAVYLFCLKKYSEIVPVRKRQLMTFICVVCSYFLVQLISEWLLEHVLNVKYDNVHEPAPILKLISSSVFSVLVLTIYESIYLSTKLSRMLLEKEQIASQQVTSTLAGLKQQISPHFLFNSLNTLSALIHEDSNRADQFVSKLSKVYRYLLENNEKRLVTLKEELSYLQSYYHLLHERFGDNLVLTISIPEDLLALKVIPLCLQISFENAIKHNAISSETPLMVTISVIVDKQYLQLSNPIQALINKSDTNNGVGITNIKKRYGFFTDKEVLITNDGKVFSIAVPLLDSTLE